MDRALAVSSMQPLIRIVLLIILALVSSTGTALSQQGSASPAKPTPAPTPIPLAKVPLEAQSTLASLQEIEANVSREVSSAEAMGGTLSELTNEIDARTAEDKRILTSSPGLEVLYRLKVAWRNLGVRLSVSARELTQHATGLEEQLGRLDKLNKAWQATLQSAKQPETPPPVLQSVQSVVDSVERSRKATEASQAQVFSLQSRISEQEARIRTVRPSIEQAENQAHCARGDMENQIKQQYQPSAGRLVTIKRGLSLSCKTSTLAMTRRPQVQLLRV